MTTNPEKFIPGRYCPYSTTCEKMGVCQNALYLRQGITDKDIPTLQTQCEIKCDIAETVELRVEAREMLEKLCSNKA